MVKMEKKLKYQRKPIEIIIMDILNLNKIKLPLIIILLLLLSCKDKDFVCADIKLNPKIIITNYQPKDDSVQSAYLISFTDNFINKKDSIIASNIINFHKKKNYESQVVLTFKTEINTKNNYLLVLNKKDRYKIESYTLKLDSAMIGTHLQKKCIIDSVKINGNFIRSVGTTLSFPKKVR